MSNNVQICTCHTVSQADCPFHGSYATFNHPTDMVNIPTPDLLLAAAVIIVVWPIYFIRGLFRQRELTQDELLRLEQRKAKKWMDKQN